MRRSAVAALLVMAGPTVGPVSAEAGRKAFIERHRCDVVERLHSIHSRGPRSISRDRFLIAAPDEHGDHYVQCIFFENDTRMHCEAASGRYSATGDLIDARAMAALKALGFGLDDPNGNLSREIEIGTQPDLDRVADLMLGALHDGYGVGGADSLRFHAPMARMPRGACPGPVS